MDIYRANETNLAAKAKAEKYAKIISKTIINAGDENFGQNQFFYDAAEGLLTAVILLIAEYISPQNVNGNMQYCRHIVSVFKIVQELIEPSKTKGRSQFQVLMEPLPADHKSRWFAGAALNSAEKFCKEKSALLIVLPEEELTKYFMVSLLIQQLYREILAVADENGGRLSNRVVFYADELGTLPAIDSLELIFSASRSGRLTMVPIIQSFGQLEKNMGRRAQKSL